MSQQNPLVADLLHGDPADTAAEPTVAFGDCDGQKSGTGIHGDAENVYICVGGNDILQITASGLIPTPGDVSKNEVLAGPTTGADAPPSYRALVAADLPYQLVVLTSAAGAGSSASEVMTVTGLAVSDTILSVCQKTPGANSEPLIGYSTQALNALTAIYPADPGAGSVIVVTVKR